MRACHGRRRPPDRSGSRMGHGVSWGAQRVGIRPSRSASLPQTTSWPWSARGLDATDHRSGGNSRPPGGIRSSWPSTLNDALMRMEMERFGGAPRAVLWISM